MTLLFLDVNAATRGERAAALRGQPGWTVEAAASLEEALAWLSQSSALDLLVTEAILDTEHTGFELRDAALAKFPEAKVLFTTRYDLSGFEGQIGGWPVLQDAPYTSEKLIVKAQAALSQPAPIPPEKPPVLAPRSVLGNYQILERLSSETESETYRAIQMTVQRPVALVLLRPELLTEPQAVDAFKNRERLKASISHPRVAPLFEAGTTQGWHFYTRELPRGRSLQEIQAAGEHLSERRIADLLHGVAEVMQFATERGHHYRRLTAADIYADGDNQASIVNVFRPAGSRPRKAKEEVAALLTLLRPLAAEGKAQGLLSALAEEEHDWAALLHDLEEVRAAMRERSIMRRIEQEGSGARIGKLPWWVWLGAVCTLIVVAGLGSWSANTTAEPAKAQPQQMVEVPAGPFIYQKRETRTLPRFWISKHEVTIGQYADFLEALKKGDPARFDHPDQPRTKTSHTPAKWADYRAAAKAGGTFNGQPISLNTPVTQVDWWDAHAFARWKGHRLPSEEEWEKAARGDNGLLYPWGSRPAKDAANLGDDYDAQGGKGGSIDGFNLWAPTNRKIKDVSPYGVCDMAGNVSEWTAGEHPGAPWPAHPDYPDLRLPVVRGGHFALKSSADLLTNRHFPESASEATLARGFRTVTDTPPSPRP